MFAKSWRYGELCVVGEEDLCAGGFEFRAKAVIEISAIFEVNSIVFETLYGSELFITASEVGG